MYIYSNRRSRSCSSSYREKLSSVRIVSTSVCTQPHCSRRGTRYVVRASTMGHGGGAPCRASLCVKGRRRRGPEKASKSTYPRVLTDFTKYAFQPLVTSDRDRYCKISLSPFLVFFFSTPRLRYLPPPPPLPLSLQSRHGRCRKRKAERRESVSRNRFPSRNEEKRSRRSNERGGNKKPVRELSASVEYLLLEGKKKRWCPW